jgi:hypothetical protein
LFSRPDLQTVDVLDPTLLRGVSDTVFDMVTLLRMGRYEDPYYFLNNVIHADYVMCNEKTGLEAQLEADPRFQNLGRVPTVNGDITTYKLRPRDDVGFLDQLETRSGSEPWRPYQRQVDDGSSTAMTARQASECVDYRPTEAELKKMATYDFFALSGRGDVIIYKDKKVYLQRTPLPEAPRWGEVLLPIAPGPEWIFKICAPEKGWGVLNVFMLTHHQQNLYCGTTDAKSAVKGPGKSAVVGFEFSRDKCRRVRATPIPDNG